MEKIGNLIEEYIDKNLDSVKAVYEKNIQYGVNVNVDNENWVDMILNGEKTIETRKGSVYKQWKELAETKPYIGIVLTRSDTTTLPTGMLVGCARLVDVVLYDTEEKFKADEPFHKVTSDSNYSFEKDGARCGLKLEDITQFNKPVKLLGAGPASMRKIKIKTC